MCGIAGVAGSENAGEAVASVDAMVAAIAHRGPDAHATRPLASAAGRNLALGAVRLRIIDLDAAADQPLSDAAGEIWTAFNGELYNFKELRAELSAHGYRFRSNSDTECLVHLWRHVDGDIARFAARLRGMFALAIWDTRTGRLVLLRDRLGIKPLYWTPTPTGIAFCSEQRPLVATGFVAGTPNLEALGGFLAKGVACGGASMLAGVHQLAPGHALEWDGGVPKVQRWWRPVFSYRADLIHQPHAESEVAAVLQDSVQRHLVADRTVGIFLSSGIDSTTIATLGATSGAQRSLTVTFPDETTYDEGGAAAATARKLGLEHVAIPTTGADAAALLPEFLRSLDSPTFDGFNTWLVCRAAKEAGLVVVLSGVGGDELFAGYHTFSRAPRLARAATVSNLLPVSLRRRLRDTFRTNARTRILARAIQAPRGVSGAYHTMRQIFDNVVIDELGLARPELATADHLADNVDAVTLLELTSFLRDQLLPDADTTSMSHSLELRVPLLDDRVVELALSLPPQVRAGGKQLLAAAAGINGSAPKRTFTLPIERWLRGPLGPIAREVLLDDDLPFSDVLPHAMRQRVWDDFVAERAAWADVWTLAMLRLWPAANGFAW